ncbi:ATPase domain-containing protein [Ramlibacter alkalitolerans]|uniref:non-specific serine/threonine protein kinase n=1 Tax=Ramlibacter alkalitolerans TaxID=2039631 RepID=A0ABS1JN18_9BURK|nr:ATPase domain-containing protein [Ramlibacter alkalitolerans]MBL0425638.1 AAA family ATPase [Ramlibacter alkalitolerans]
MDEAAADGSLRSTGVPGLDGILGGGLTPHRIYLIEGEPGAGKTTTGLQFLLEGARAGENVVYISLAETRDELTAVAASHGWDISGIHVHEVLPDEDLLGASDRPMFHASEVEMADTLRTILQVVEDRKPSRVVLDSLSELQLLADTPLRYRRQVLALKKFFSHRHCTVMLLDDRTASAAGDLQVRSIAHGVIQLEHTVKDYGTERRRLRIVKHRGRDVVGGLHDYNLVRGGMVVHPRLVAADTRSIQAREQRTTGLPQLDSLLGGGIEEGTSTLIVGPPGSGKSSLAAQIAAAATTHGDRAAMFLFEETASSVLHRADGIQQPLRDALAGGLLTMQQVDPAELSPGQFSAAVAAAVASGVKVVVIDSLNGYLNAVPEERFLSMYLHELLTYLAQHKVVTLLVAVQQGMLGGNMSSALDASYVADNVLMLRYFELAGQVRQAISVFKKRGSGHERTIRDFSLTSAGIHVGEILSGYRGVLSGVPVPVEPHPAGAP